MKRIHFGGGEVPAHRTVLAKQGVRQLAFNVQPVADSRSGNAGDVESMEPFYVVFYASQTVNGDATAVIKKYADETSIVIGDELGSDLPHVPVWNGDDLEECFELTVGSGQVFVSEADCVIPDNARKLSHFAGRNPQVRFWTVSSKANVLALPYLTDVIVTGWISAQKHRELQVWDGHKVVRSPRASRAKQLDTHHAQITNLGGNMDLLRDGDVNASVDLALKSWLQYELVTSTPLPHLPGNVGVGGVALARQAERPRERETKLLPSLVAVQADDESGYIAPASTAMKQCNNCKISHLCPEFEPGASCAFNIPVTIRSKDQLRSIVSTLLEVQAQRALEARFMEDVLGEGPTNEAGRELDRFFTMGEKAKAMEEEGMTITQTVKGSGGLVSAFFGNKVGESARALPAPVESDDVIDAVLGDDD